MRNRHGTAGTTKVSSVFGLRSRPKLFGGGEDKWSGSEGGDINLLSEYVQLSYGDGVIEIDSNIIYGGAQTQKHVHVSL